MAFGNNRGGEQPRAHFRLAGGSKITFRHPYFAGQIDTKDKGAVDEIDISRCCKLEGRFFEANQNMDSARQVVLVDGTVVTICNKILAGTISIPAIPTTGEVATGDFISACQLIRSTGDTVGGLIYKSDPVNGKMKTRLYYGVTVVRCPDDVSEGNDVGVYNIVLSYAGWIEAVANTSVDGKKIIWATGTKEGLLAEFTPYAMQNCDGNGGTNSAPMTADLPNGIKDDVSADADTYDNINEKAFFESAQKTVKNEAWEKGVISNATKVTNS